MRNECGWVLALWLAAGCADGGATTRAADARPTDPDGGAEPGDAPAPVAPFDAGPTTSPDAGEAPAPDDRAFLHADLWSIYFNDRTRCGAEAAFLDMCRRRGEDCARHRASWEACDPDRIVYGQIGPEQQGMRNCSRGPFPEIGGCDPRRFDFDRLRFHFYGAEWSGNWPFATLKVFEAGVDVRDALGDGLIAVSNVPGRAEAAMDGISNHGLPGRSAGCAMRGETSGDEAYRRPFGGFAWIEVPTDRPVTVVAAAGGSFGGMGFAGCDRGAPTHEPWIGDAPGAVLGCVHRIEYRFEPGGHYLFDYGRIERLPRAAPPAVLVDAFADRDLRDPAACGVTP